MTNVKFHVCISLQFKHFTVNVKFLILLMAYLFFIQKRIRYQVTLNEICINEKM